MTGLRSSAAEADLHDRHLRAELMVKAFSYSKPDGITSDRSFVRLARTERVRCSVQIVKPEAGENKLHYHTNIDSFWFVLKGQVRFYGPDNLVTGEFGPMEGTFTPAYSRYGFENIGDCDLEILQVMSLLQPAQATGRNDVSV